MKVSVGKWIGFNADWLKGKYKGQRFGQAFLNTLLPKIKDSFLFYEEDTIKACALAADKYVDFNSRESYREGEVSQELKDAIKRNLHN